MIIFIGIVVASFIALLIYQFVEFISIGRYNLYVMLVNLLCIVLFAGSLGLVTYAKAQGKSDYIENLCGTELTPLTIIFYPEVADVEVDYCLDTMGTQPSSTNP